LKDEKERGAITIIIMYVEEYTVINPSERRTRTKREGDNNPRKGKEKKKYIN